MLHADSTKGKYLSRLKVKKVCHKLLFLGDLLEVGVKGISCMKNNIKLSYGNLRLTIFPVD